MIEPVLADFADWALDVPLRILLIVIGAVIVARLASRAISGAVRRSADSSLQQRLKAATAMAPALRESEEAAARSGQRVQAVSSVLAGAVSFVVYLIALFLVLAELGVDLAPLLAGAGVAGLAIGFGAQSLVKDCFSGVFILLEDQYAVGDIVDVGEATGVVENVSLRATRLRSVDGVVWHVPNGEIVRVGNMSQHWSRSLLDIEVAYDTDLKRAKELIAEVAGEYAETDEEVLDEPEVWGVEALGASGIVIRLVVKTKPSAQWRVSRELRERVKERFDAEGIEIPYPTQTLWMRSAVAESGGEGEGSAQP
jgi:small-conductance mechanosensitive channel